MKLKQLLSKLHNIVVEIVFWCSLVVVAWFAGQILLFASFKVPSASMSPALIDGDNVLVWKPTLGARIFHLFDALEGKRVTIHRLPGMRKVRRNDVLVFHIPYPHGPDHIEMHLLKYYVKRCVGLPGDTLSIHNGFYHVGGYNGALGNVESQQRVAERNSASFLPGVYHTFPRDSVVRWNIKEFGPICIPKKGFSVVMTRTNYLFYGKLIEWEQEKKLDCMDDTVFLDGQKLESYVFEKNYYFMAGDRTEDSQDSRYWGLAPEEYIVGKVAFIWKSVDRYTRRFRWERFLKKVE
ncbi:MAG: signal peptidase I [Dysgonamonadaceae bacterium]|jgi:signal peptidase I|nr:signal peptidase I [Dysgonamonadaceae bacterium]